MRYIFKRCFAWERYVLALTLVMYDLPPVQQIASLTGTRLRIELRKTKSGVKVPSWKTVITGYRAHRLLQLVRPYLVGQKAFQSDIALSHGPLSETRVSLDKDVYKAELLSSFKWLSSK